MSSRSLSRFLKAAQSGQDMAEYAILLGLIALIVGVSLVFLGDRLNAVWQNISDMFASAVNRGS